MILDLDKCLEEKLTKDRECTEVYENLKELYLTGTVETRHYGEPTGQLRSWDLPTR